MPMPIANNAVVGAKSGGQAYLYSFGGIDSTLSWSGITSASFRYNTGSGDWEAIADLPDTLGKIASAASLVRDKIYIIGGYHVFASGNELSSNRVHIYDPEANTYLADGAPIPVAIDDHVQAVWRDSLIYVVSGWSNTSNVANVQVYNPALNSWSVGTAVPNTGDYKVFGGSGSIAGDTLYYIGGARMGSSFPLGSVLRKGIINPLDPTEISWSTVMDPLALGYRMAAFPVASSASVTPVPVWVGGSTTSYNFNAIAYNGSGGVEPESRAVYLSGDTLLEETGISVFPPVMDLRGAAVFPNADAGQFIYIAGGIGPGQQVSDKTYLLNVELVDALPDFSEVGIKLNPSIGTGFFIELPFAVDAFKLSVFDLQGRLVFDRQFFSETAYFDLAGRTPATYLVFVETSRGFFSGKIVLAE